MAKENTVIQMYGAVSGTAATIDIPDDGFLLSAVLQMRLDSNADGDAHNCSLEFGSTSVNTSNDTRSLLANLQVACQLTTSGILQTVASHLFTFGDGIKVFGGERLYLHNTAIAGTFGFARALLVFNFATFVARRR